MSLYILYLIHTRTHTHTHTHTDEYREHYYAKRPGIKKRDYGDISERVELRKKLQCKSFDWFLKHVYPELPLPNENLWHGGAVSHPFTPSHPHTPTPHTPTQLHNPQSRLCLDTYGHREGGEVGLYSCHGQAGNQVSVSLTLFM